MNLDIHERDIRRAARFDQRPDTGGPPAIDTPEGYEFIEYIHRGGQGLVYRAKHLQTGRIVALKVLLLGATSTDEQRERFAREISLTARLDHPHIVPLYDVGTIGRVPYCAMKYIEGLPITEYAELYSYRERIRMFIKVCDAVAHAHQRAVLHRDLKPSNVLVDTTGEPWVLDFGLAKDLFTSVQADVSVTGHIMGTVPYLSPEQARGDSQGVDVCTDVYALGLILFELLAGGPPYELPADPLAACRMICEQEPATIRSILHKDSALWVRAQDIDDDIEAIVAKALRKDKQLRYPSVLDLKADLTRYLDGEAVSAREDQQMYVLRKTIRRYRKPLTIAAIFILGTITGLAIMWQRAENLNDTYRAGLTLGGYVRLGSAERDAGQTEKAIDLWKKAIDIAEAYPSNEPTMIKNHYSSLHMIAETLLEDDIDQAREYSKKAVVLAERMANRFPEDPVWSQQLSFSQMLEGKLCLEEREWSAANDHFAQAVSIREELLLSGGNEPDLRDDLAVALLAYGHSLRKLERMEKSLAAYTRAYEIRTALLEEYPHSIEYAFGVLWAEWKLSNWYFVQDKPEDTATALQWLARAEDRLNGIQARPESQARSRVISGARAAIESNKKTLLKRQDSLS